MSDSDFSEACGRLGESFVALSAVLVALELTVPTAVPLDRTAKLHIEWRKHRGEWGFFILRQTGDRDPITNTNLVERIKAANKLWDLVKEIERHKATRLEDVRNAATRVQALVSALESRV